jgi:putative endonuclease
MYTVYVLQSEKDGRLYKGFTNNIERRLSEHNNGYVASTKRYIPWKCVYTEPAPDSMTARSREKFLKSGHGRDFLKSILLSKKT